MWSGMHTPARAATSKFEHPLRPLDVPLHARNLVGAKTEPNQMFQNSVLFLEVLLFFNTAHGVHTAGERGPLAGFTLSMLSRAWKLLGIFFNQSFRFICARVQTLIISIYIYNRGWSSTQ